MTNPVGPVVKAPAQAFAYPASTPRSPGCAARVPTRGIAFPPRFIGTN